MPSGGARVGAGRPRKTPGDSVATPKKRNLTPVVRSRIVAAPAALAPEPPVDRMATVGASGTIVAMEPLDYMLMVINDEGADKDRRDRLAIAAAPFLHGKIGESGVKAERNRAAVKAGVGKFAPVAPPLKLVGGK